MAGGLFHLAFFGLFVGFFGIRGYYFRQAKRVRGEVSYIEGWAHRALRLLVGVPFMLALAGYMLWPGLLGWATFPLPAWARGLGLALGLASMALMVWVQRALGANFDSAGEPYPAGASAANRPWRAGVGFGSSSQVMTRTSVIAMPIKSC